MEQDDIADCKYVNTDTFQFKGSKSPKSEHKMKHEEVEAFLPTETHSSMAQSKNQITGKKRTKRVLRKFAKIAIQQKNDLNLTL